MTKINKLISNWPKGTIKTVKELQKLGYSPQLLKVYLNSKWLDLFMRGMYKLHNDKIDWTGVLYGIQNKNDTTLHVGAKSALEFKGYAHYLRESKVTLFSNREENFNLWLDKFNNVELKRNEIFDYKSKSLLTNFNTGNFKIIISVPELACMEMMYLIPNIQSFDEAFLIMENLTTLRPILVNQLLEECKSIKVKRLFMWMSEKVNHSWLEDIDTSNINFGKGKRLIVKNGTLNKKYNITVPKEYEK